MKKLTAILLAAAMVLSLAACGSSGSAAPAPAAEKSEAAAPAAEKSEAAAPAEEKSEAAAPAEEASAASSAEAAPAGDEVDKSDWLTLNLTYATFLAADAPSADGIALFQENLDKYMGEGYITIETYPNGTLLGVADICEGVENGVADLGFCMMSVVTGKFPVEQVAEIAGPYYASTRAGCAALKEYLDTVQPAEFEKVIPLFPLEQVPMAICSTKPINSIDDLKGLQIRATGYSADAITRWGAVPVSMALSEVYEAMRNGLLDGCISSVGAFGNSMFQEVADYCTILPYIGYSCILMMNRDTYNSMPESQRAAFDAAADETYTNFYSRYLEELENDELSQKYLHDIAAIEGVKWLDEETLKPFADALDGLTDDYKKVLNEQGFDGDYLVDYYLELLDKYNEMYPPVPENYSKWY